MLRFPGFAWQGTLSSIQGDFGKGEFGKGDSLSESSNVATLQCQRQYLWKMPGTPTGAGISGAARATWLQLHGGASSWRNQNKGWEKDGETFYAEQLKLPSGKST